MIAKNELSSRKHFIFSPINTLVTSLFKAKRFVNETRIMDLNSENVVL